MTTNKTAQQKVVGVGMYLEMRKSVDAKYVSQMIILPEVSEADVKVPMVMLNRRLSAIAPKKTWSRFASGTTARREHAIGTIKEQCILNVSAFVQSSLQRHINAGYKTVGEPIFFEVTQEDAYAIRDMKTPYKVIGRINKARKALGYPEDLIPKPVASSSF